ncbi:hypothetical protein ACHAPT_000465 [Fusarium lateritium]
MLLINTISFLAVQATLGASAAVPHDQGIEHEGHVKPYDDSGLAPRATVTPRFFPPILDPLGLNKHNNKKPKATKATKPKAKPKAAATKPKTTKAARAARPLVRRDGGAIGKIGRFIESAAEAVGVDIESIPEFLIDGRFDIPAIVQNVPGCLDKATRDALSSVEDALSGLVPCAQDSDAEIEISPNGIEYEADGLPKCLDKAGQEALESIQDVLANFGDCATETDGASTEG